MPTQHYIPTKVIPYINNRTIYNEKQKRDITSSMIPISSLKSNYRRKRKCIWNHQVLGKPFTYMKVNETTRES